MDKKLKSKSKFLSLVLRHKPEQIGLQLDPHGWANIEELIAKAGIGPGTRISLDEIKQIVATNDKQRFRISDDGLFIRANQGHSIEVDLELQVQVPPQHLYHGSAIKNKQSILKSGLIPGKRLHVHLSSDTGTAIKVGRRHGKAMVFTVLAAAMQQRGFDFYLSENGVWLVVRVPPEFIRCE